MLVAQGADAGGHTGQIGTFSLVPRIVDMAEGRPVLAAGGVSTGRHVAAALTLGASGVWTGTRWLATREHAQDPFINEQLIKADTADAIISRADSGKTLRQIRTSWTEEWSAPGAPSPLKMPLQDILIGDLLGQIERHRVEPLMHTPAGQGVAYIQRVESVSEVCDDLVRETDEALAVNQDILAGLGE
jgi:NAD(P)H-dependent flavin oxidoreductase YrpB (nitropropane dioxygenase family)